MNEIISVVIPAYNAESYIENCINSVLSQSYKYIELIIINDGSTDRTAAIADRFQEQFPDIVRVLHIKNKGVTYARLQGIRICRGSWIGFVDSDDEIETDMYERLHKNAVKYNADISHCGMITIVNGGERVHEFGNKGIIIQQSTEGALKGLLDGSYEPSLCNKLFRRELVFGVIHDGKMNTSIKYNEDLLMNFYLFRKSVRSVYDDFCGYHYLAHPVTASRGIFRIEKISDPVKVRKEIADLVGPEHKDIAFRQYLLACMRAYAHLANQKEYKELATVFKTELLKNRAKWGLLKKRELAKLSILLINPGLYKKTYHIYEMYFQKKVYE